MQGETIDPKRIGIMDWNIYHAAVAKMKELQFEIDPKTDQQIQDVIISMEKDVPLEVSVDVIVHIFVGKLNADNDVAFVNAINEYIVGHNYNSLNNDEAIALIAYRNEFEASGQNVWDGSREDHYARWILNRRQPQVDPKLAEQIEDAFKYHDLDEQQLLDIAFINDEGRRLSYLLAQLPPSRYRAMALTALEDAATYAKKAVSTRR